MTKINRQKIRIEKQEEKENKLICRMYIDNVLHEIQNIYLQYIFITNCVEVWRII